MSNSRKRDFLPVLGIFSSVQTAARLQRWIACATTAVASIDDDDALSQTVSTINIILVQYVARSPEILLPGVTKKATTMHFHGRQTSTWYQSTRQCARQYQYGGKHHQRAAIYGTGIPWPPSTARHTTMLHADRNSLLGAGL